MIRFFDFVIHIPLEWIECGTGLIVVADPFEFVVRATGEHRGTAHRIESGLVIVVIGHHIFYFYPLLN